MKYYLAYGSNLNIEQMKYRCPKAKVVGSSILHDYELVFKGPLTVEPRLDSKVPIGLWLITDECELALDRYEGYPYLYRKEELPIIIDEIETTAIIYIMNGDREESLPSQRYLEIVKQGYEDFDFDFEIIYKALL